MDEAGLALELAERAVASLVEARDVEGEPVALAEPPIAVRHRAPAPAARA